MVNRSLLICLTCAVLPLIGKETAINDIEKWKVQRRKELEKAFQGMENYTYQGKPIPDEVKAQVFNDAGIEIMPSILKDQFERISSDDAKITFLSDLLEKYPSEKRKEIVNNLIQIKTNKLLLEQESVCKEAGKQGNPAYVETSSVIDCINMTHFNTFFRPTMTDMLVNRISFNELDSLNQVGVWVEPFFMTTNFRQGDDPLKFNLYTVGISAGGEYVFYDRWVLGLGAAYSHSGVSWVEGDASISLNTAYFGPSLSYVFPKGYLNLTIFAAANLYTASRSVELFPKLVTPSLTEPQWTNWNLVGRLEGNVSCPIGSSFFIYPSAKIDYLSVFIPEISEEIEEEVAILIDKSNASFVSAKLGLKTTREFYKPSFGFLIPSLSGGWLFFSPIGKPEYRYHIEECAPFKKVVEITSWNQYYIGAGFSLVHKRGVLCSLEYEYDFGADSPLQIANIRVEWSW